MREIERRVQTMGLSWPMVAQELGVDRTTIAHIRTGRDRMSLGLLHQIAVWFPNDEAIQRLAWDYILFEVETARERDGRERTMTPEGKDLGAILDRESAARLRGVVGDFGRHSVEGSGLLICGSDAATLSGSLGYLRAELEVRSIRVMRERGSAGIAASRVQPLLAVAALLVDRIEFASDSMLALLAQRISLGKVVIATCLDRARLEARGEVAQRISGHCSAIEVSRSSTEHDGC